MALYTQNSAEVMLWPEPMESSWQWLPSGPSTSLAKKMPHLSLADVLFIGAVTAIPGDRRPWGAISWMAEVFGISRVSVYALGERIKQRLQTPSQPTKLPATWLRRAGGCSAIRSV